jgi:NAD+ kinase
MKNILIIPNREKPRAMKYAAKLEQQLDKLKFSGQAPKFAVILGGDGMMIKSARRLAPRGIPLLGVNLGKLGFLAETDIRNAVSTIKKVLVGKYFVEERSMLEAELFYRGKARQKFLALNDVVIKNGKSSRVIDLELYIGKRFVEETTGDGLIVSTPTGSTAYCMASGGPIVQPRASVFIVVPISSHSLTQRPLVLPDTEEILIKVAPRREEVNLSVDGQINVPLKRGYSVRIRKSEIKTKLLVVNRDDYFKVLREKFKWGT